MVVRRMARRPYTPERLAHDFLAVFPDRPVANAAPTTSAELEADIASARVFPGGFFAFAKHWQFHNRESGEVMSFAQLWPGQIGFAELMMREPWLFALKAGKLGFTELECAWDGYVAWSKQASSRVHLFSKKEDAAKEMLDYVKFGLDHLEPAWAIRFIGSDQRELDAAKAGTKLFRFRVNDQVDDIRQVVAYATGEHPSINETCQHAHVDELAHMQDPKSVWEAIETTVAPGGSCHIVTRGAGESEFLENLWRATRKAIDGAIQPGPSKIVGYFAPWSARPDRDRAWLEEVASRQTAAGLAHFAPETPDDAFTGDDENAYIPIEQWDHCLDAYLRDHPLLPGDKAPVIIAADAATTRDTFGCVAVTRHPLRPDDPAARAEKDWRPDQWEDGRIDYTTIEAWLRTVCEGGCALGHPIYPAGDPRRETWFAGANCQAMKGQDWRPGECPACLSGARTEPLNVYQIAYDPHQLEQMMQGLRRDRVAWCYEFPQGSERLDADRGLRDAIVSRRIGHPGLPGLRDHLQNARAKVQRDEDSKLRIVKKAAHRKVDLAVALSMAVHECLRLNI